ncbi:conserved hypothetical protein [Nitratiruptor sp. SB155-2]|nr:conserved hypothetical protein [Nitratiruptor sp. SB155-2]
MKKFFLILVFTCFLLSSPLTTEQKIYTTILKALFPKDSIIRIWTDDPTKEDLLKLLPLNIKLTHKSNADILILYHTPNIKTDKMIFVGSYNLLKIYKEQAIGGFYWQKGRPNLIFIKPNLQKYHLILPKELQKYEEESF